ncbi:lactate racemase domain-containing protein [Kyrpidia spormannii]|uniref:LarA-like N-terminal domain-containing protein n=1 Tax=Kyrpidia spormannii TaxID=2055160 RepID=A0A6F9E797_9BACL|nr:lactate racemase domain-containing protein [Kyrpidia spormannii]CAB3392323.1 conserved protein of unknown function [Kyrpidia spormannii]
MKWARVRRNLETPEIADLEGVVERETAAVLGRAFDRPLRVAIPAGSRGIFGIDRILRTVVQTIRSFGGDPFLFAAMGSHGGGTAEGQRQILASLGISEEAVGAPVSCSSEVVQVGETPSGLPVYVAREAAEADAILVVNRVKPHTSFHGPHESGLAKMLSVGMGRAAGAEAVHRLGVGHLPGVVPEIAGEVLRRLPVIGGLGIVENSRERPAHIRRFRAADLLAGDRALLQEARRLMPGLPTDRLDLLVVREMGKNFSGTGMDTNVIGRLRITGVPEPQDVQITYIAVCDLSEASHGNATGIGLADFTTEKLAAKIDRAATYLNCLTSGFVARAAVPMTFSSEKEMLDAAFRALKRPPHQVRWMAVANTLELGEVRVGEALWEEAQTWPDVAGVGALRDVTFTADGDLVWEEEEEGKDHG